MTIQALDACHSIIIFMHFIAKVGLEMFRIGIKGLRQSFCFYLLFHSESRRENKIPDQERWKKCKSFYLIFIFITS